MESLGLIIVAAAVFALLGRLIRMPTIVTYILAGLTLGPVTGLVEVGDMLEIISEIGIALLLFLVGLELSFNKIKDVGKVAIVAGIGQVVFTAAGGLVVCWLLDFSLMESLFLATALTFSSTVVVVKLLDQKGELDSLYGRIAVGIFLVQDMVVVIVLTLLAGLARAGGTEGIDTGSIALGVGTAFGGMAILLIGVLLAAKYVLPKPFGWMARSPDGLFIWALAWCFLAVLAAEALHLSLEIGAFLAGLSLAQLPYNDDLRRRVHPLMNFFIAVFFVSLGIRMELGAASTEWLTVVVLSLFVLIGNPFIFMLIIARMGYAERTSFFTSVTVAQISEFSFIFAAMGVSSGLIGEETLSITAAVGLITIAASAYMILYNQQLYLFCKKLGVLKPFGASGRSEQDEAKPLEDHILIVGMNPLGRKLAKALHGAQYTVLAIDTDPVKLRGLPCPTLIGNIEYSSVLEDAGLERAKLAISALQIEDTNNLLAYKSAQAGIPCAIHAFDRSLMQDLLDLDAEYLLTPKIDGIVKQLEILRQEGLLKA